MSEVAIVNDAKVVSKGQVTILPNIRNLLEIDTGDLLEMPLFGL